LCLTAIYWYPYTVCTDFNDSLSVSPVCNNKGKTVPINAITAYNYGGMAPLIPSPST